MHEKITRFQLTSLAPDLEDLSPLLELGLLESPATFDDPEVPVLDPEVPAVDLEVPAVFDDPEAVSIESKSIFFDLN